MPLKMIRIINALKWKSPRYILATLNKDHTAFLYNSTEHENKHSKQKVFRHSHRGSPLPHPAAFLPQ